MTDAPAPDVSRTGTPERPPLPPRRRSVAAMILGGVIGLIGVILTIGGGYLAILGGSLYYVLTGIAMLFVRCAGGLSHHPDESVEREDVAAAIDVLCGVLERLAR